MEMEGQITFLSKYKLEEKITERKQEAELRLKRQRYKPNRSPRHVSAAITTFIASNNNSTVAIPAINQ
jgi:hypothetical protein